MDEKKLIEIIKNEVEKYFKETKEIENVKTGEKIHFLGTDMLLKEELSKKYIFDETADKLIISDIDIKNFVSLTEGTYSDELSEEILECILKGKEIYLIEEGIQWKIYPQIPLKLREKYENGLKFLMSCGIKVESRLNIVESLKEVGEFYTGKILTLSSLKKALGNRWKKIVISQETTVTSLAKDYADTNEIKIIKR